jgi:hypothetical protein
MIDLSLLHSKNRELAIRHISCTFSFSSNMRHKKAKQKQIYNSTTLNMPPCWLKRGQKRRQEQDEPESSTTAVKKRTIVEATPTDEQTLNALNAVLEANLNNQIAECINEKEIFKTLMKSVYPRQDCPEMQSLKLKKH